MTIHRVNAIVQTRSAFIREVAVFSIIPCSIAPFMAPVLLCVTLVTFMSGQLHKLIASQFLQQKPYVLYASVAEIDYLCMFAVIPNL